MPFKDFLPFFKEVSLMDKINFAFILTLFYAICGIKKYFYIHFQINYYLLDISYYFKSFFVLFILYFYNNFFARCLELSENIKQTVYFCAVHDDLCNIEKKTIDRTSVFINVTFI